MGSLAGERGWGSWNAEGSVVDPEEESVEESLDDSSLEDSPGRLFLFWGGWFGGALGFPLGGGLGFGFGFGCCLGGWVGVRGLGLHGRCTRGWGGGLCGHLLAVRRRWGHVANAAPPLDARRENAAAGCHVVHHGREELEHGDGLQVQLLKQRTQIDGPGIASWPTKDHPNGARVRRVDLDVLHLHGG